MNDICDLCKWHFEESTTQAYERYKTNGKKICRDCYRLEHAEERAKIRNEKKQEKPIDQRILDIKQIYGIVSAPLLMRKFKLTFQEATDIATEVNK